jgi:ADP-heptose:LPS heptosyltransferase
VKKILVIQLCRIGDILMTGPLLRGLRREHPSAEISLMVMDTFAVTPLPRPLYDRLLAFPLGGLAITLAQKQVGWEPALEELRAFVKGITDTPFDLVVNLTHTDMSALITSLVPARKRVGFVARADRRRGIDSPWMTHLRATARSRDYTCFHIVDLFSWTANIGRDAAGLEIDIAPEDHAWADGFFRDQGLAGKTVLAMQLGASQESKQWPTERFGALADALDPALGEILLVGSSGERPLGDAFLARVRRRTISSVGDSSLRQLAALLQRCRLLITNDTGPMHVATAVGTQVIDLSSGRVCAHETGPYGVANLVIEPEMACYPCPLESECHHFACRSAVTPEDAAGVVRYALGLGPVPAISGARVLQAARVGPTGRLEFRPIGSAPTLKDVVRTAAATVWERSLQAPRRAGDGWDDEVDTADSASLVTADGADLVDRDYVVRQLEIVAQEADATVARARALPKAAPAKLQQLANEMQASLEKLLAIGESTRATHAIVTHLRHEIDSIAAADLAAMARAQAAAYSATAARARAVAEKLGVLATS